jgi:glucuronate isomerase
MSTAGTAFLSDDFLLHSEVARELYHDYAAKMPIFDFHCHLPPGDVATDRRFANLAEIWLHGDHYKWRAMRTNGIGEKRITGDASDREKFQAWAETVPYTLGNPLYHWTHLELRRPFGIDDRVLNPDTAGEIWDQTAAMLAKPEFSTRGLLRQMDVRAVFTTDDPADSLEHHRAIAQEQSGDGAEFRTVVRPSFRPDKALAVSQPAELNRYLDTLGEAADIDIRSFDDLCEALRRRMDLFDQVGCRVSDHALVSPVAAESAEARAPAVFDRARQGEEVDAGDAEAFQTALLLFLGREYARRGWIMQLHLGALRNNNTRMFRAIGPDSGFDSMADQPMAERLTAFLDALDRDDLLPKTIIYNLNPRDNELLASTIGDFQDGTVPGKVQLGPAWWFNDQKHGIEWHLRAVANMSLLSRFVGMLTDSRSFLSFPRHEYFRRILCDTLGAWVVKGEAPRDMSLLGRMVEDVSWRNAVAFFDMSETLTTRSNATGVPS